MFKVLIVDDERLIREGIKNSISWSEHRISEVMTAKDGLEALQMMETFMPDILFTDIKMPRMNGLELLKKVKKLNERIKIIILSGYDDFEYVQAALQDGALDYLRKTIDMDGLIKVIKKSIEEIEKDRAKIEKEQLLANLLEMSMPLLKHKYLNILISGPVNSENMLQKLKFIGIDFNFNNCSIAIIAIDNQIILRDSRSIEEWLLIKYNLNKIIEDNISDQALVFENNFEQFVVIYSLNRCNALDNDNDVINNFKIIKTEVNRTLNINVSIGISNKCQGVDHISDCYEQAVNVLDHRMFTGQGSIILASDVKKNIVSYYHLDSEQQRFLVSSLRAGEKEQALKLINDIFDNIMSMQNLSKNNLQGLCIEVLTIISRVLEEYDITLQSITGNNFIDFEEINRYETCMDMKQWVVSIIEKAVDNIINTKIVGTRKIVEKVKRYVDENYCNEITLGMAAEMVHISPNYFSSIFSTEVGQGFLEYITAKRIEKAKELLCKKGVKVHEVGNEVGYDNQYYFSRIFKKHTGMSPLEYKEKLLNNK
jgi:two-component system, response regulator YesN